PQGALRGGAEPDGAIRRAGRPRSSPSFGESGLLARATVLGSTHAGDVGALLMPSKMSASPYPCRRSAVPVPLSKSIASLRKAFWHFRHGGADQVKLWWSREDSTKLAAFRKGLWHLRHGGISGFRTWRSRQSARRAQPSTVTGGRPGSTAASEVAVRNSNLAREGFPFPEMRTEPEYAPRQDHVLY